MKHLQQCAIGLIVLGLSLAAQANAATGSATTFRIMSDEEIAAHRANMAELQGAAREQYRDSQYAQLRQRARENGYAMPTTPPWASAVQAADDGPVAAMPAAARAIPSAAERHAAMRQKMQQVRQGTTSPQASQTAGEAPAAMPAQPMLAADQDPAIIDTESDAAASDHPVAREAATVEAAATGGADAPTPAVESAPDHAIARQSATADATDDRGLAALEDFPSPQAAGAAMAAYRAAMRARFDEFMNERQAEREEAIRRQREQRPVQSRNRLPPPFPPSHPAYGPRYPAAYPGYRTPYWQQP